MFESPAPDNYEAPVPLAEMDVMALLELRSQINMMLPAIALKDMNLEEELVIQFQTAKAFQHEVLSSGEEANKKAQTLNACTATLQNLIKMQSEYHTAERLKNIESRLIKALNTIPDEHLKEFFAWYEAGAQ